MPRAPTHSGNNFVITNSAVAQPRINKNCQKSTEIKQVNKEILVAKNDAKLLDNNIIHIRQTCRSKNFKRWVSDESQQMHLFID